SEIANEQQSVASGFQQSWKRERSIESEIANEQQSIASGFQQSWKRERQRLYYRRCRKYYKISERQYESSS
ncbi:hypothetical protein, partial [Leptospira weilii]|uniref:hypothetical protein n=1 Tax=Leptospira weilii TaxID=28184 RepID=UPI001F3EDA96